MTTKVQITIQPPKREISVNYIKGVQNKIHAVHNRLNAERTKRLIKYLNFLRCG